VVPYVSKESHKGDFGDHNGAFEIWIQDKYRAKYNVHSKLYGDGMPDKIDVSSILDKIQYSIYKFIQLSPEEMEMLKENIDIPWHRFSDDSY